MPEAEGGAVPAQSKGSWSSFLKVRRRYLSIPREWPFPDKSSQLRPSTVTWPR